MSFSAFRWLILEKHFLVLQQNMLWILSLLIFLISFIYLLRTADSPRAFVVLRTKFYFRFLSELAATVISLSESLCSSGSLKLFDYVFSNISPTLTLPSFMIFSPAVPVHVEGMILWLIPFIIYDKNAPLIRVTFSDCVQPLIWCMTRLFRNDIIKTSSLCLFQNVYLHSKCCSYCAFGMMQIVYYCSTNFGYRNFTTICCFQNSFLISS